MRLALIPIIGMVLAAPPAWGTLMVYSNYASWSAAVGSPIETITFNSASGGPFSAGYTEGGVLFEGLSAGVYNGQLYATHAGYCRKDRSAHFCGFGCRFRCAGRA